MCVCACECRCRLRSAMLDALQLSLQVLGSEFWSCTNTVYVLKCWAFSPVLVFVLFSKILSIENLFLFVLWGMIFIFASTYLCLRVSLCNTYIHIIFLIFKCPKVCIEKWMLSPLISLESFSCTKLPLIYIARL